MQSYVINSQKRKPQVIMLAFTIIAILFIQLFVPLLVHAESLNDRTIHFNVRSVLTSVKNPTASYSYDNSASVKGIGHFVVKSFHYEDKTDDKFGATLYVYSDKPFTYGHDNADKYNCLVKNGIYYCALGFQSSALSSYTYVYSGLINCTDFSSESAYEEAIENSFDSLDLSKDDYKELVFDDSTTVSTDDLSLASLGSYTKSACTLSKTDSGWDFVMPSEAGVNVNWTYKKQVDGSFMRLTYKGKFRKSILDVSYVDKQIVIGGEGVDATVVIDNIDCSNTDYFISYQDLLAKCKEQNNFDKGYNFEIENIYVQRFAKIGDNLCRSRLYRVGMEMRTDISTDGSASDTITLKPTTAVKGTTDSSSDNFVGDTDQSDFVTDIVADKPITDIDFSDGDNTFLQQFLWFYNCLQSLKKSIGQFPALIAEVFSFLPSQFILFIGLAISAVIVLRLIGR